MCCGQTRTSGLNAPGAVTAVFGTESGEVICLVADFSLNDAEPYTRVLWQGQVSLNTITGSPITDGYSVILADAQGVIFCLDLVLGWTLWKINPTGTGWGVVQNAVAMDAFANVYVGTRNGNLVALVSYSTCTACCCCVLDVWLR
jgi:hypothetical protein